jgi:hypothetical protein
MNGRAAKAPRTAKSRPGQPTTDKALLRSTTELQRTQRKEMQPGVNTGEHVPYAKVLWFGGWAKSERFVNHA